MFIKPPKKRLEFEKILRELGYKDRSPIYFSEERTKQVNYLCGGSDAIGVYGSIIPYFNKKSYLYTEFYQNYNNPDIKERISVLAENILFNEKTRIGEISWKVVYTKDPTEFTLEQRKKMFYAFIKDSHNDLINGALSLKPQVGDILVGNPYGPKINQGHTQESITIGTKQRAIFAKKFGFGDVKSDGFSYGRYDENLMLRPL